MKNHRRYLSVVRQKRTKIVAGGQHGQKCIVPIKQIVFGPSVALYS